LQGLRLLERCGSCRYMLHCFANLPFQLTVEDYAVSKVPKENYSCLEIYQNQHPDAVLLILRMTTPLGT